MAGTHGRGFWILDDVTPLRQEAEAAKATDAYLFKPETAVRVRPGMNDPTEWPPEMPHGENPPPGGIIDYYLASNAMGPVKLDVLDASRQGDPLLLERRPGAEARSRPRPGGVQQGVRADADGPELRGAALLAGAPMVLSTNAGMHRFSWDLHFDPIGPEPREAGRGKAYRNTRTRTWTRRGRPRAITRCG